MAIRSILAVVAIVLTPMAAPASDNIRTERVQFEARRSTTTIQGVIEGEVVVDYIVAATEGQYLTVTFSSNSKSAYFEVFRPGSDSKPTFFGPTQGDAHSATLESTGDWRIRVQQLHAAARRGDTAAYTLEIEVAAAPPLKLRLRPMIIDDMPPTTAYFDRQADRFPAVQ